MTKKHNIILQPSGSRGQVEEGQSIRSAARDLGVEIESICAENATCGKCMVLIEEGRFEKYNIDSRRENVSPVSTEEAAYFARRPKLLKDKGWEVGQVRLSCQCKIQGDVLINVPEESRGNKQIVRKSATQREIEIKPSIRKYLVSMSPPNLERPIADWERLAKGLETSMGLVRRGEENLPRWSDFTVDYTCLRTLSATLREATPEKGAGWNVTVSVWQDKEIVQVQSGYHEESYGAAVDIGSTTVALYLCNLRTGELLAAESEMNPQIVYGEDVMSRIQYTIEHKDGLEKLHKAIISTLNQLLKQAVKTANMSLRAQVATLAPHASAGEQSPDEEEKPVEEDTPLNRGLLRREERPPRNDITTGRLLREERPHNDIKVEDILEMVLVGNSTMHHLLLNLPPKDLGLAPFVPAIHKSVDVKARELGLHINSAG
ncbi:MAG: 2Fe-2S iron-sulfur cluster-binding protein, partial [Anaerolineales bacterium]|nr:2Fe-2S iron-sulfur cluster-binding protein [Anaerolineales bacterium]